MMKKKRLRPISQRHIDLAMTAIHESDSRRKPNTFTTSRVLCNIGLPKSLDHNRLLETLTAMGLISYKYDQRLNEKVVALEDAGRRYFVDRQEQKAQRRHDLLIAIIPTLLGAVLSEPLWTLIRWVYALLVGESQGS